MYSILILCYYLLLNYTEIINFETETFYAESLDDRTQTREAHQKNNGLHIKISVMQMTGL